MLSVRPILPLKGNHFMERILKKNNKLTVFVAMKVIKNIKNAIILFVGKLSVT